MFCPPSVLLCALHQPFSAVLLVKKAGVPLSHAQPKHGAEPLGLVQLELRSALQLLVQGRRADLHRPRDVLQLVAAVADVRPDHLSICHRSLSFLYRGLRLTIFGCSIVRG